MCPAIGHDRRLPGVWAGLAPASTLTHMDETTDVIDHDVEQTDADLVDEELLVEEISIDGMCGVY